MIPRDMASGECRWVGREDIHVYCVAPMVESMQPHGRMGWTRGPATYCVVCPDAGLDYGTWVSFGEVAALVKKAMGAEKTFCASTKSFSDPCSAASETAA